MFKKKVSKKQTLHDNSLNLIQNLSLEAMKVNLLEDRIELGLFNNLCGCGSCCDCRNVRNGRD